MPKQKQPDRYREQTGGHGGEGAGRGKTAEGVKRRQLLCPE